MAPQWLTVQPQLGGYYVACSICRVAGTLAPAEAQHFAQQHSVHRSASPTHFGAGDAVAAFAKPVARAFGMPENCTPCEARRRMLNRMVPAVPWFRRR